jgi:hypothetical protein
MKINSLISKFLTNKWVLNIVAFLTIFNIIGYIVRGNLNSILYFILFACLIRYFSKNMTIVLGAPLIIVNLLSLTGNMMEGMKNNDDDKTNDDKTNDDKTNDDKKKDVKKETDTIDTNEKSKEENTQQGFEVGRRKNRGYNIDYATTVEDAYDELNNALGNDGIQRLTEDTQKLMKQQAQLVKTMEGMSQLVENIQPMVGQLEQMISSSTEK